jgi:conjugal transfer pilus assembly protein TraW
VQGAEVGSLLSQWTQRSSASSTPPGALAGSEQALAKAASQMPNARLALRNTIDGQPVIPPGMTLKQASMYVSHDWMAQHIAQARTLVFISMSMPRPIIRSILADIWNHPKLRSEAVVVVRGWQLVQQLGSLQPSLEHQVNVAVDPTLFESYAIQRVPAVARQDAQGAWRVLYGDRDLPSAAVERLDQDKDAGKVRGQTWPIAEPDLIAVMQERMKQYAWEKHAQQATDHFFAALPSRAPSLPESEKPLTLFHDPSVVVQHDIRLPDGRLVARAGQVLNPLLDKAMPWSTWRAIVFNATSPWEVRQAKAWAAQYPTARLMMTSPPGTQAGYVAIEKAFGRPVFLADPLVVQRLGVRFSPALIWPSGPQLQIDVAPIPADPAALPRTVSAKGGS